MSQEEILSYLDLPEKVISRLAPDLAGDEDLKQDCLTAMLEALPRFKGKSALSTYLWRICANTVRSFLRRQRPAPAPLPSDLSAPGCGRHMDATDFRIDRAALTAGEKHVLHAIEAAGYNKSAAARVLHITRYQLEKTAKSAGKKLK